jgi:hypothetical protein
VCLRVSQQLRQLCAACILVPELLLNGTTMTEVAAAAPINSGRRVWNMLRELHTCCNAVLDVNNCCAALVSPHVYGSMYYRVGRLPSPATIGSVQNTMGGHMALYSLAQHDNAGYSAAACLPHSCLLAHSRLASGLSHVRRHCK